MKRLVALIAFSLVGCTAAQGPTPEVIEKASQAVVTISFMPENPTERARVHCSGVAIEPGVIITAAHCTSIDKNRQYLIGYKDGSTTVGRLVGKAPADDAAVISVDPRSNSHFVPIGWAPLVGERVFVVGHPQALLWSVTLGIVSNNERTLESADPHINRPTWLQIDAAVNGGNSGGALFNEYGELVGIIILKRAGTDGIGFAMPITYFLLSLEGLLP